MFETRALREDALVAFFACKLIGDRNAPNLHLDHR